MPRHTSGLTRDLEVLDLLGSDFAWSQGGLGVQQIANTVQRDKGQISRVCQTLSAVGLINRDNATKRYRLGHHLYALAMRTQEAHLAFLSRATLLDLMAHTEESAHLTVLRGGAIMTVRTELAQHPERDSSFDGISLPALRTASGRAILATFNKEELFAWWEEHGTFREQPSYLSHRPIDSQVAQRLRSKPSSIRSLGKLHRVVGNIRKTGFAISDGELTENIVDAASPIRNSAGIVVGAIAVGARSERIKDRFQSLGTAVKNSAESLSRELGWSPTNLD
jgi:DNA-binding IclR family transcriptional regulator